VAAPTSVRAEATSISTTVLRWSYSGSSGLAVYRSTDGSAYTLVDSSVLSTATSFTDTGLETGTKYWYKISDDLGSTFSSVVTVYTHFCPDQFNNQVFNLPRFDGDEQQADNLNAMAERIERVLGDSFNDPDTCAACPVDGAVIIDCTDGCRDFYVVADADINSISIQRCGAQLPPITLCVPHAHVASSNAPTVSLVVTAPSGQVLRESSQL